MFGIVFRTGNKTSALLSGHLLHGITTANSETNKDSCRPSQTGISGNMWKTAED